MDKISVDIQANVSPAIVKELLQEAFKCRPAYVVESTTKSVVVYFPKQRGDRRSGRKHDEVSRIVRGAINFLSDNDHFVEHNNEAFRINCAHSRFRPTEGQIKSLVAHINGLPWVKSATKKGGHILVHPHRIQTSPQRRRYALSLTCMQIIKG